jgi:hypothetical protein
MATINQLSAASTVSGGDQLPVYSTSNGDARKLSINALLEYFQQSFASPTVATNIYTPSTGFNLTVPTPVAQQQWMILQPVSGLATGTITLPLNTSTADGTEVLVTTTQQVSSFTLAGNGASNIYGSPTALTADDFFRVRYVQSTNSWYRIS